MQCYCSILKAYIFSLAVILSQSSTMYSVMLSYMKQLAVKESLSVTLGSLLTQGVPQGSVLGPLHFKMLSLFPTDYYNKRLSEDKRSQLKVKRKKKIQLLNCI